MYLFITNTNQHLLSKHKSYNVIKVQKDQISALIRCALIYNYLILEQSIDPIILTVHALNNCFIT